MPQLGDLASWNIFWLILGFAFLFLEVLTPGVVLMFFGLGAWTVLLANFITPLPVIVQWVIFIIMSLVYLIILRRKVAVILSRKEKGRSDSLKDPLVANQYIGREVEVIKDIGSDVGGQVELNGSVWQARAKTNISRGSWVKVVEVKDLVLWVEPL
ncbi:MAG: NfeD family protein [Deltaproteobacteria bacterium]|jgi:membrane protein implicated in regulation of membrane protease activity|nr:NfeD family protein [Deltaproteobacteria bacterium]